MELQLVEEALLVPINPLVVVMVTTLFFLQSLQPVVVPVEQVLHHIKDLMEVLVAGRQVTPVLNYPVVTGLVGKATPVVLD
jgi:hypothetical protein